MDLAEWLKGLGLGEHATTFVENDIDFDILHHLTDADLKELGISSLGNRRRLLAAIAQRETASESPAASTEVAGSERRQVTVLFADLCGFTLLSQSLDPEEIRELVGRYTGLADGVIAGYGGTIDKHIG